MYLHPINQAMDSSAKVTAFVLCIFLFSGITGCNNSTQKERAAQERSFLQKKAQELAQEINLEGVKEVELSSPAERAASDWTNYLNVKSEIEKFDHYSLQNLINNSDNLVQIVGELLDSIPPKFNTTPVKSRLTVLNTKVHILRQETKPQNVDPKELQDSGRAIYQALSNLNIQINEIFLRQLPDFEVDMDRRQDSIKTQREKDVSSQKGGN